MHIMQDEASLVGFYQRDEDSFTKPSQKCSVSRAKKKGKTMKKILFLLELNSKRQEQIIALVINVSSMITSRLID